MVVQPCHCLKGCMASSSVLNMIFATENLVKHQRRERETMLLACTPTPAEVQDWQPVQLGNEPLAFQLRFWT